MMRDMLQIHTNVCLKAILVLSSFGDRKWRHKGSMQLGIAMSTTALDPLL